MEAIFFVFDIVMMITLLFGILRADKKRDAEYVGFFGYTEKKITRNPGKSSSDRF